MHLWWAATMVTMSLVTLGGLTLSPFSEGGEMNSLLKAWLTSMFQALNRAAVARVFPRCDGERRGQDGDVWRGGQHRAEHQDQQGFLPIIFTFLIVYSLVFKSI